MISELEVINYKCFRNLKIKNLKRVNLFTGKNNVGKSALLECVFNLFDSYNSNLLLRTLKFRGLNNMVLSIDSLPLIWKDFFYESNTNETIEIIARNRDASVYQLNIKYLKNSLYNETSQIQNAQDEIINQTASNYVLECLLYRNEKILNHSILQLVETTNLNLNGSPLNQIKVIPKLTELIYDLGFVEYFSDKVQNIVRDNIVNNTSSAIKNGRKPLILDFLKHIIPNIKDILILNSDLNNNLPLIHIDEGGVIKPIQYYGDGVFKFLKIIVKISEMPKGSIFLIDEIENGLHYTLYQKLWEIIIELAEKNDIQVWATTHDKEVAESFNNLLQKEENQDKLILHELFYNYDNTIGVKSRNKEVLNYIFEFDKNFRGE